MLDKENLYIEWEKRHVKKLNMAQKVNSNAAKNFYLWLNSLMLNYMIIFPLGIDEHWQKYEGITSTELSNEAIELQYHVFYGGVLSTLVTYLEQFFCEFLIEKLEDKKITNKDDLIKCLYKKYKYHISFQSLKSVKIYYRDVLGIDIEKSEYFDLLQETLYKYRHLFVHSFGKDSIDTDMISIIDITDVETGIDFSMELINYIDNEK